MKRKYRHGEIIKTIGELADWLASGKSVYMRNQYLHFGWVSSMQLRYLMQCVERGVVVQALPNKEKEDARKVEDGKTIEDCPFFEGCTGLRFPDDWEVYRGFWLKGFADAKKEGEDV